MIRRRAHRTAAAIFAAAVLVCPAVFARTPDPGRFEKQVVVGRCADPMQIEVHRGDVWWIELAGAVRKYDAETGAVVRVADMPVRVHTEIGLLGLALDPEFATNRRLFLLHAPAARPGFLAIDRFAVAEDGTIDSAAPTHILDWPIDEAMPVHMGGSLQFDPDGNLWFSTGDNTPPIPQHPVDFRPGRSLFDAFRTGGNADDLRGAICRIRPRDAGGYDVPEGNLSEMLRGARPEIYAMGCRNPFRFSIDPDTGRLYWGDVGPNIDTRMGPNGHDEFHATDAPGNFGWPWVTGPNEPFLRYDFASDEVGGPYDIDKPVNASPNNTGPKTLPPPVPAWLWYPSGDSPEFPELGSGGRAAMAGPVLRFGAGRDAKLGLPRSLEGRLLIYDWTRNWIKTVRVGASGDPAGIEPFAERLAWRKPIDMELADDGTLYIAEYGDAWRGNRDARIVRIVYRRGNRPPVPSLEVDREAGRHPLPVRFDAAGSTDPDGNGPVGYRWNFAGQAVADGARATHTFETPGIHRVRLTVFDDAGASASVEREIRVGNAPPVVRVLEPPDGGFFLWGGTIRVRAGVTDPEEGGTAEGTIDPARVTLRLAYERPRPDMPGVVPDPGEELVRGSTCFACHGRDRAGLGPSYLDVALRYQDDTRARDTLVRKILHGGSGVWGPVPMPPHPQHGQADAEMMVDWILSLTGDWSQQLTAGAEGTFQLPPGPPRGMDGGKFRVIAGYTDFGTAQAPPLEGEATVVLHDPSRRPAYADDQQRAEVVEVFEGQQGMVGQYRSGGWSRFEQVRLDGIASVGFLYAAPEGRGGRVELRAGSPDGLLLGAVDLPPTGQWHEWKTTEIDLSAVPTGSVDLFVRVIGPDDEPRVNIARVNFISRKPERATPQLPGPALP